MFQNGRKKRESQPTRIHLSRELSLALYDIGGLVAAALQRPPVNNAFGTICATGRRHSTLFPPLTPPSLTLRSRSLSVPLGPGFPTIIHHRGHSASFVPLPTGRESFPSRPCLNISIYIYQPFVFYSQFTKMFYCRC